MERTKFPLIERVAFVIAKREERSGKRSAHYITFAFPDNTCLEFSDTGVVYNELEERNRVILKYKKIGKFEQLPVFFSYERIEEQPNNSQRD